MALKFFRYSTDFFLILISSLFLVLSFPDFNLGFFAWIGLLPLLFALNGKSLKYGFFLALMCGVLFFMGTFSWILEVPKYTLLHHAILAVYLGSYFAFFGLMFNFVSARLGATPALFAGPFIWVSLEYFRSNLSFLALPWALLAHSQYQYPLVIQIASFAGSYSISFLIMMVNSALASLFLGRFRSILPQEIPPNLPLPAPGRKKTSEGGITTSESGATTTPPFIKRDTGGFVYHLPLLITAASLLLGSLFYGSFTITNTITGNKIKMSLIQGNIEQKKKWDPKYAREIMQTYAELTKKASKDQPSLIVWPETATPGGINRDIRLHIEVRAIAKNAGTYLLLGSSQQRKFGEKGTMELKYLNSAFLINPEPKLTKQKRYDKIRLFPFGEYLPYKGIIPWSLIKVQESGDYTPGKEFTIFEHRDFRFGVNICWENVFPDMVRQFVTRGAQFMVNLTNEAHFGKTAAPHQLVGISVFRAVENRIYVVRCANTGVSCMIDPYGRIVDRIEDKNGQDIFVRGTMTGWVIPLDSKTIYTRYGDWFVWLVLVGTLIFLILSFSEKRE